MRPDFKGFGPEVRRQLSSMDTGLAQTASKAGGLGKELNSVGRIASGFLAAGAIQSGARKFADGLKGATDEASNLNEALSKSNIVFRENGAEIERWASGAARSFGQSKEQALSAAGSFGNMFDQLGIGSQQATQMSKGITELASDFASFHNADITEVLSSQSAAFRGEYDALQKFLPLINAANVEQKAMAQTGKDNAKELTAQEKALAVYALMLEGAGEAQGDFQRTASGAANQARILDAVNKDSAANMGSKLLPIQKAVNAALLEMPEPMRLAAGAAAKFSPEAITMAGALGQASLAAKGFAPSMAAANVAMAGALPLLGPLAVGVLAVAAAYTLWGDAIAESQKKRTSDLDKSFLGDLYRSVGLLGEAKTKVQDYSGSIGKLGEKLGEAAKSQLAQKTLDTARAMEEAKRKGGDFGQILKDIESTAGGMNSKLKDILTTLNGFRSVPTPEMLGYKASIAEVDLSLASLTVQHDKAKEAVKPHIAILDAYIERLEREKKLHPENAEAIDKEIGRTDAQKDARLRDVDAIQAQIDKETAKKDTLVNQLDLMQAVIDKNIAVQGAAAGTTLKSQGQTKSFADLNVEIKGAGDLFSNLPAPVAATGSAFFVATPQTAGFGDELAEANKYAADFGASIPPIPALIDATGSSASNATPGVQGFAEALKEAGEAAGSFVGGQIANLIPNIPGRAAGGWASGLTWVGERGPELVNLPSGSYVNSHAQSKQMGAGTTIHIGNITLPGVHNVQDFLAELKRLQAQELRLAGRGV